MEQGFSTATPRYEVRSPGWEHLEVFESAWLAYQCVFDMALKYPDTDFIVVEKINWEEKVIFKLKCELGGGLNNVQDFYRSMISLFQSKLVETVAWRRSDER